MAWGRNHEQLEGEEKKYFIESIFRWMDYFLPNELGNFPANLEKGTLYAKLLLDRKSDLITHNIITHDELKQHNLSCQESFKNIFEFEKAGQITIDLSDAHRLCNALSFELPTPLQPILNFVLPFHSPLVSVIPSTPLFTNLSPITGSKRGENPEREENPLKKKKANGADNNIEIKDYPMTDFIVKKIKEAPNLSAKKLKNLEKKVDLLKIVEDLSDYLLQKENKYIENEDLFKNFEERLNQKNITKITATKLCNTFLDSFIEPLKKTKSIIKINKKLVPKVSLREDEKKMIECIIKWRRVFSTLKNVNLKKKEPSVSCHAAQGPGYPMTNFIMTKIKEDTDLSSQELKNLEKKFYLLEIVEDLSGHLLGVSDENLFKNFNTELAKKNIAISEKEKLTASFLFNKFWDFTESLKNQKHIINNGANLVPSDSLLEDQKKMIESIIKWKNVFANTYTQSRT